VKPAFGTVPGSWGYREEAGYIISGRGGQKENYVAVAELQMV
jgi:hypothetical protein